MFLFNDFGQSFTIKVAMALAGAYLGIKAPELFLSSQISKRQASMKMAFPDALDLLLICVEIGHVDRTRLSQVSTEIGTQSVPLAEEFASARPSCPISPSAARPMKTSRCAPVSRA